jgi:AraC family transcriptional regulator, regulatory protein of adaptative response / methylated-DNA-[protein]-cysteine methyltransferase
MRDDVRQASRHYAVIASAIHYIRAHLRSQPSLADIASAVHMSPYHLQRVFAQWAGISPKRFLQFLTKEYAMQQLAESADVLSVAEDVGLSGTSRLHDLMVTCEALTPGEIKTGGAGVAMGYGVAPSPFGNVLAGWTERGICHFAFCVADEAVMITELSSLWPAASLMRDDVRAHELLARVFPRTPTPGTLHLVLRGSNFQIKVWQALLHTEPGHVVSYSQLARRVGAPDAQRAVGSALAANTLGFLIPCHRVIRESGHITHYRWEPERKLAMLGWEASQAVGR